MNKKCIMIACAFFVAVALQAKVSLPAFFSDGMVMQQQSQASLWGKASKGKIVEVTTGWDGQTYTTRADEQGKWKLTVQTPAAGGPYDITFDDGERTRIKDILMGELWICLKDNPLIVNASEVIIRYIRVRVGDKYKTDADGIGGGRYGQHHVILDHLTSSWSIDECLSIYKTKNLTVQWCMINQSLTCSVHTKGCHGFGGIWGGYKATFHHNLLANHSSRNPRFSSVDSTKMVDFRNNVVFNWGFKAAYGGGRYGEINMVANYYKPGPGTQCPYKLLDVAEDGTGKYYISGNILEENVAVSQDNRKGVFGKDSLACLVSLPFAYETIQEDTPQEAYRRVLEQAGCSLVRDNYDSEIVSQIKRGISLYGKNGFIDTPAQAGGWPELRKGTPLQDSDGDGMPDKWEKEHKLNPQDAGDASSFTICKYYTNIELYINGLVKY